IDDSLDADSEMEKKSSVENNFVMAVTQIRQELNNDLKQLAKAACEWDGWSIWDAFNRDRSRSPIRRTVATQTGEDVVELQEQGDGRGGLQDVRHNAAEVPDQPALDGECNNGRTKDQIVASAVPDADEGRETEGNE
ncbi:unnamed protein product, partial [Symbiodinium pilosum]